MKSVTTQRFRKDFGSLPARIQAKARNTYKLWKINPNHPSLDFKAIHAREPIFAARIGLGYRAKGLLEEEALIWFWVGSHEDYNNIIKNL